MRGGFRPPRPRGRPRHSDSKASTVIHAASASSTTATVSSAPFVASRICSASAVIVIAIMNTIGTPTASRRAMPFFVRASHSDRPTSVSPASSWLIEPNSDQRTLYAGAALPSGVVTVCATKYAGSASVTKVPTAPPSRDFQPVNSVNRWRASRVATSSVS